LQQGRMNDEAEDLRAMWRTLARYRWLILACVVACSAALTTGAFLMTPVYRVAVIMAPASADRTSGILGSALGQLGGLAAIAGVNVGSADSETEEALAVLRSRQFTERFIHDRNLMPELFARKWDAAAGRWKVPPESQPTPARAYHLFDEKIRTITRDKKTGLVTLQVDWKDRNEAAVWANDLAQRLNDEMREREIADAGASIGFLERELQNTTVVATREAIGRLLESQVKKRMLANVTREYVFRIVDSAMPPDADNPARPQKALMIVAGPLLGLVVGVILALAINAIARARGV